MRRYALLAAYASVTLCLPLAEGPQTAGFVQRTHTACTAYAHRMHSVRTPRAQRTVRPRDTGVLPRLASDQTTFQIHMVHTCPLSWTRGGQAGAYNAQLTLTESGGVADRQPRHRITINWHWHTCPQIKENNALQNP